MWIPTDKKKKKHLSIHIFSVFSPALQCSTPRQPVLLPVQCIVAGRICVYYTVEKNSKQWTTRHDFQGRGEFWMKHWSLDTNQTQAHKVQFWKGRKGQHVYSELQMVLCQEIADKENCDALVVQNWKYPKHSYSGTAISRINNETFLTNHCDYKIKYWGLINI